ncbi:MAG: hypothetical protein AAB676_00315 [Verrucomicrobiota bacterium]
MTLPKKQTALSFYGVGLLVAGLEEFITQGVLKHSYGGWILPTILAFLPFLVAVRFLDKILSRRLSEPGAILIYYLAAGSLGLLFEWFMMGLAPWSNPQAPLLAMVVFQLGMFSFWGGVALAPRLLLDARAVVSRVRNSCRLFLIFGMAIIYLVAFAAPQEARFLATIASVLITFLALNFFYFQYVQAVRKPADGGAMVPMMNDE